MCLKLETRGLINKTIYGGLAGFKQLEAHNEARLICLSYAIYNKLTQEKEYEKRLLLNPKLSFISDEVNQIHHISQEDLNKEGVKVIEALKEFLKDLERVEEVFVNNKKFYCNIIKSELFRLGENKLIRKFQKTKMTCLGHLCKERLFGRIYKFQEAYEKIIGKEFV